MSSKSLARQWNGCKAHKEMQLQHSEVVERQARFRPDANGLWDRMRGAHGRMRKLNEKEVQQSQKRARKERVNLIFEQLAERRMLQHGATACHASTQRS